MDDADFTDKAAANGFDAGRNANFLADLAGIIAKKSKAVAAASKETLSEYRGIGIALGEAREALKAERGAFHKWCDASEFPFSRAWRLRLIQLAENWDAILAAVEALPEASRKWTVDGAISAWQAAKREAKGGSESGNDAGEGSTKKERSKKETEAERLRRQLAEALARIEELENALKGTKAGASAGKGKQKAANDAKPVDGATKARANKVWGLYKRGATPGECGAAKARLDEMARKFGMDFDTFARECGLAA
ncbi:hypothetical protein [Martelella mangrovi]|uniref:DUF3102 domain-containing protein n=1 Tax=Martelella mangrovi TaxID=1397477 RepID=A0ABV2IFH7_9HYPH